LDLPDRAFVAPRHRERHVSQTAAALLNAMRQAANLHRP
jgi:hypothetical protein